MNPYKINLITKTIMIFIFLQINYYSPLIFKWLANN